MAYYKVCPDPGETCDCTESKRDQLKAEILALTEEECALLLQSFEIYKQHPELTPEECVKRADQGATNTPGGKAEQISKPVSISSITENQGERQV